MKIKSQEVLLWNGSAGLVWLFARKSTQVVMIVEKLQAAPDTVGNCCKRKFARTGVKDTIGMQNLEGCHHPNWWYVTDTSVIVL